MTFQIKKSDLPCSEAEFAERVDAFVDRINEYYRHIAGVEADKENPDLKPEERRYAFPPPEAEDLVSRAIRKNGPLSAVADYKIVGPSLTERKQALLDDVRKREADLIAEVMPPAKQRHWIFREMDMPAEGERSEDDVAFLADMKSRRETQSAITRWAAKLEHDIFDLTEETVDAFEISPFHG